MDCDINIVGPGPDQLSISGRRSQRVFRFATVSTRGPSFAGHHRRLNTPATNWTVLSTLLASPTGYFTFTQHPKPTTEPVFQGSMAVEDTPRPNVNGTTYSGPSKKFLRGECLPRGMPYEILTTMNRIILFLMTLCPLLAWAAPTKPFELREGDRVVFLGDTLMEREKDFGYIELMMTLRFPERNVTFRNLGWSADTPVGISRVSFDWPKGEGEMFRVLMEQVRQVQPTVVVLGYGMASSLEDAAATEMERRSRRNHPSPRPSPR